MVGDDNKVETSVARKVGHVARLDPGPIEIVIHGSAVFFVNDGFGQDKLARTIAEEDAFGTAVVSSFAARLSIEGHQVQVAVAVEINGIEAGEEVHVLDVADVEVFLVGARMNALAGTVKQMHAHLASGHEDVLNTVIVVVQRHTIGVGVGPSVENDRLERGHFHFLVGHVVYGAVHLDVGARLGVEEFERYGVGAVLQFILPIKGVGRAVVAGGGYGHHAVHLAVEGYLELGHKLVVGIGDVAVEHDACTVELKFVLASFFLTEVFDVRREQFRLHVGEALLQTYGFWGLHFDGHIVFAHCTAVFLNHLQSQVVAHLISFVERNLGVGEHAVFDLTQVGHPLLRYPAVAFHGGQHTCSRRGVAVGVLAAAGGNLHGFAKVAGSVEQAHDHVSAVHRGVDVAGSQNQFGAAHVAAVVLVVECPAAFPVGGVFLVPCDDGIDALVELALLGNGLQRLLHDGFDVVFHEGQGIHGTDEDAAVPAVAVVHDVAYLVGNGRGGVGHARRHQSGEVAFNLEVDAVGMGIVFPVARLGGHDAAQDVVSRLLVGVPQRVARMGKGQGKRVDMGVQSVFVIRVHEGQVHVDVVVKRGNVVEVVLQMVFVVLDFRSVGNHHAAVHKLRGAAVGAPDGLGCPTALDFVHQHFFRQGHGAFIPAVLRQQRGARQERQHHTCKQGSEASESRFLSHIFSFYPLISAIVCAKLVTLAEINKQIGNFFIILYSEPVKTPMKVATRKNENGVGGT